MKRPCFLVVDREFAGSISTRKLLIETAKMNVITAYSGAEALEVHARFPAVSGVVIDASLKDLRCADVVKALKARDPLLPVVVIESDRAMCDGADYAVRSFNPAQLLEVLRGIEPRESEAIEEHDEELSRQAEEGEGSR